MVVAQRCIASEPILPRGKAPLAYRAVLLVHAVRYTATRHTMGRRRQGVAGVCHAAGGYAGLMALQEASSCRLSRRWGSRWAGAPSGTPPLSSVDRAGTLRQQGKRGRHKHTLSRRSAGDEAKAATGMAARDKTPHKAAQRNSHTDCGTDKGVHTSAAPISQDDDLHALRIERPFFVQPDQPLIVATTVPYAAVQDP